MAQIEDNIVIQLAKFNDVESSISNAMWSNHCKQQITINQGDQVMISKSYIDTRNLSSSAIVILEDTPLELEFYFYWINDGNPGSLTSGLNLPTDTTNPWWLFNNSGGDYNPPKYTVQLTLQSVPNLTMATNPYSAPSGDFPTQQTTNSVQQKVFADGRPYLLCYTDNKPFTQTWRYTLPAGTYSPDNLATLLTTAMAEVRKDSSISLNKPHAIDWFDPYAPKVNLPLETTLDQPFVVNTSGNPPLWAQSCFIDVQEGQAFGILNAQPYLQINQNNGLPTNWYQGAVGTITNPGQSVGVQNEQSPGPAPVPSLCFKNIISDCPIPDPTINLPAFEPGPIINASQMALGLFYEIVTLGQTNWAIAGDTANPPAVGNQFVCIAIPPSTDPPFSYLLMEQGVEYEISNLGLFWAQQGLDTDWSGNGGYPQIGNVFTCSSNPVALYPITSTTFTYINIGLTYRIDYSQGIDWSIFGFTGNGPVESFDGIITGDTYLIQYGGVVFGRTGQFQDTHWSALFNTGNVVISGAQVVAVEDGPAGYWNPFTSLSDLYNVTDGLSVTVVTAGDVDWGLFGATNAGQSNPFSYQNMITGSKYTISSLGLPYKTGYDTPWAAMNAIPIVVGTEFINSGVVNIQFTQADLFYFTVGLTITVTNLGNVDWTKFGWTGPDSEVQYGNMTAGLAYTIISTGALMATGIPDCPWIDTGFTSNGLYATTTDCQEPRALIELNNYTDITTYIAVGLNIQVQAGGTVSWVDFGYTGGQLNDFEFVVTIVPSNIPTDVTCQAFILQTGLACLTSDFPSTITFTITEIPPVNDSMICAGYINGTGTVTAKQYPNNFTFTTTSFPETVPDYILPFTYLINPTGTVKQIAEVPFQFTCTIVPNPLPTITGSQGFTGVCIGTGQVIYPNGGQGTCREIGLNPTSPNYYIYPLKLNSDPGSINSFEDEIIRGVNTRMLNYNFPLIGSTEIELAFNDLANTFQWNYTHSPILQSVPGTSVSFSEVVGIVHSFTADVANTPGFVSSTAKLVSKSGILFKKMEPQNFWFNVLGFSSDLLVTEAELGLSNVGILNPILLPTDVNRFTYERFNSITTRGLLTTAMNFETTNTFPNLEPSYVDGMFYNNPITAPAQSLNSSVVDSWYDYELALNFNNLVINPTYPDNLSYVEGTTPSGGSYRSPPSWNQSWYQALNTTVTIPAISVPLLLSDEYGHYLLEVEGYGGDKNGLHNEESKYNIKSIISSYYVNPGSFTSGVFLDPQVYTHVGEPLVLNNFRVRILDPKTMSPVKGLNPNSSVYIQINKAYSKLQQSQVADS